MTICEFRKYVENKSVCLVRPIDRKKYFEIKKAIEDYNKDVKHKKPLNLYKLARATKHDTHTISKIVHIFGTSVPEDALPNEKPPLVFTREKSKRGRWYYCVKLNNSLPIGEAIATEGKDVKENRDSKTTVEEDKSFNSEKIDEVKQWKDKQNK